ncbi:MAG: hypothetical protein H6604_02940 [Flavobacteriales bacterium]|nr:hypothetical protein [Flavobacteriales bacterium]
MNTPVIKLDILNYILNLKNETVLNKFIQIIEEEKRKTVAHTINGKSLTKEEYKKELEEAEERINSGEFISHNQLKSEIKNW